MQSYYYHKLWAELLISNEKGPLFNRFETRIQMQSFLRECSSEGKKSVGEEVKQDKKGEQKEKRQ